MVGICGERAVLALDFFNARKLLIAMTFARRNRIIGGNWVIVGLVRREIGAVEFVRILDGKRRRKDAVAVGRFLYGSHMQCYRQS